MKNELFDLSQLPESTRKAMAHIAQQFETGNRPIDAVKPLLELGFAFMIAAESGDLEPGKYGVFTVDENGAISLNFSEEE